MYRLYTQNCIYIYIYILVLVYIYIYIYTHTYMYIYIYTHLSNTACLTQVFFKRGEYCGRL